MYLNKKIASLTTPVVGATKLHHIEGAVKAVDMELKDSEIAYLEEPYVPHPLAGVMAQNKRTNAGENHGLGDRQSKIER